MKLVRSLCTVLLTASVALAATAAVGTVRGTIRKVDSVGRTIVVATVDGTEHTLHIARNTGVHGVETAGKASWRGLKEGSEIVAHYTEKGSRETAVEIDNVGREGLRAMDGAVVRVDRAASTVVVKSVDGTEHTFRATDHAVVSLGRDTKNVTVYYSEETGKRVAHFFQRL